MNLSILNVIRSIFAINPDSFNVDVVEEVVEKTGEDSRVVRKHIQIHHSLESIRRIEENEEKNVH